MIRFILPIAVLLGASALDQAKADECHTAVDQFGPAIMELKTLSEDAPRLISNDFGSREKREVLRTTLRDKLYVFDRIIARIHIYCGDLGDQTELDLHNMRSGLQSIIYNLRD